MIATEDDRTRVYGWAIFLMLISLYWGCEVNSNIGHVSFCGVAAVWYFSKNSDLSPSWPCKLLCHYMLIQWIFVIHVCISMYE